MKVRQLIEELQEYPADKDIEIVSSERIEDGEVLELESITTNTSQKTVDMNIKGTRKKRKEEGEKKLVLDLDSLYTDGYYYTEFDITGASHSITIDADDKEAFLNAFAQTWREKAEKMLEKVEEEWKFQ